MSKQRKLLLITSGFPFGDIERGFISEEFEALSKEFDLHIIAVGRTEELVHPFPQSVPVEKFFHRFSWRSPKSIVRFLAGAFRPITVLEILRSISIKSPKLTLMRTKQIIFYAVKAYSAAKYIEQIVTNEKTDIIYTYWCTEMTLAAAVLKKKYKNIKLVTRFHGHDLYTERRPENWQPFRRYITENADKLIFACRHGLEYYTERWGTPNLAKAELHYLGCKKASRIRNNKKEQLKIISCSNLIPLKRVDLIIDALALLPGIIPIRWDHFGDGTEMNTLKHRASEKLPPNVEYYFHGRVPNNTIEKQYQSISPDIFITSSSSEGGAPVSIQEAFSMGIPAIGTDVGGIPDLIINNLTGFLLPADLSAQVLCDAVERYYKLPQEQKEQMSNNAHALWNDKFNASNNAQEFTEMLINMERTY